MLAFEILPELYRAVRAQSLKRAVDEHLGQTKGHVERVEQAFRVLGLDPSSNLSPALEGLKREHDELSAKLVGDQLADVFHAAAAAHTEHFELAAYTAAIDLAKALGLDEVLGFLEANRDEEQETLKTLEGIQERLSQEAAS